MPHPICQHRGCSAPASHSAADDSAEWLHVCEKHLACSFRPDAWRRLERPTTMRALTEAEVAFKVDMEPEEMDPEFDNPATMRFIKRRLANEQWEAWCSLTVTATWKSPEGRTYTGTATLGGVSIDAGQNADGIRVARFVDAYAKESELFDEALNELNEGLRERICEAADLIAALRKP